MLLKDIGIKISHFASWVGSIGISPGDSKELRSHKIILTIALYVTVLNIAYFSYEYYQMGRYKAALTLLIGAVFFTINLIFFRFHRNFKIIRNNFFIGMYVYIIVYQSLMGGYVGSTGYINYAISVLVGVQLFYKKRSIKYAWFFIYIATAVILYFLEPIISKDMVPLSDDIILLTYLNNFILISATVFISVNYFISIIQTEKVKSDTLIRNILPDSVVNELNNHGKSHPIMAHNATVIFMDFVGFTRITQEMEPHEMVSNLNEHFTNFDQIFLGHQVEKLKTIGDGYMAVGGLPITNNTHTIDAALASLKILNYIEKKNKGKQVEWNLRIGIHTGPMVAGIIGESKFSYDVWGKHVNHCSRLESLSKPGFINVSDHFMEHTKDFFEFESRGLIEIKNSPPSHMYYLIDLKEELRSARFQPNNKFYELYDEYAKTTIATAKP